MCGSRAAIWANMSEGSEVGEAQGVCEADEEEDRDGQGEGGRSVSFWGSACAAGGVEILAGGMGATGEWTREQGRKEEGGEGGCAPW